MSMATRRRGNMKAARHDNKVYYRYYDWDARGEFIPGEGISIIYPRTDYILDVSYDPAKNRTRVKCIRTDPKNVSVITIGVGKGDIPCS